MNIINRLSIKHKTYILVLLSVTVAVILSLLSNQSLKTIRLQLDYLTFSSKIERFTNQLLVEEQKYRLNSNGSLYNLKAADDAYNSAITNIDKIYQTLNAVDNLEQSDFLHQYQQKTQQLTDSYKKLYLKGVRLLSELNNQATILERQGQRITQFIQLYVEAKRVEVKKKMTQKTIEKINNGSNIWQYTYVTRLHEETYRLSPSKKVFETFNKDFDFMISEWQRLKDMSDQKDEFETLDKFILAAKKYEMAMFLWVKLHQQLVSDVLPEMKSLGESVIKSAISSSKNSITQMSSVHDSLVLTLFVVSLFTVIFGFFIGTMVARSISSSLNSFKDGLLNFFQFLNQHRQSTQPILVTGEDEISEMAEVVNKQIVKIENVLKRKMDFHKALLEWSKVNYQDDKLTFKKATAISAKALDVERVSIWLFDEGSKDLLRCVSLYNKNSNSYDSGAILQAKNYPVYFKALHRREIMVIEDAKNDPRSIEFTDKFLIPNDIYSMLDLPIIIEGQLYGVICYQKQKIKKIWSSDELDFVNSMVYAISLALEIKKRHVTQEQLKAQKEIFQHQAGHDSLTQLPNRFLFNDRLIQLLKQAKRKKSKLAVLFIDLDHFKGINDSLGHKMGDELLIEVGRRLKGKIRQTDTLARLGGDEFAVVLNEIENNDRVLEVTQNLLKVMNETIKLAEHSFHMTLSVGVSIFPDDGETPEELLKNADAAMYHAKDDGRNTYQFYNQSMTEKAFERVTMDVNFRKALAKQQFVVHYQPQINAKTEEFIGMEALVRWQHPDLGLIFPANFLSFAQDTGLIIPMDKWVMKTAMTQFASWYEQGLKPGKLALNLSVLQLKDNKFIDLLSKQMQEINYLPEWLELEITESLLMQDPKRSIELLNELKRMGIHIAIDDFGTGYSSLSQLKYLPINKLKIAHAFISEVPQNEEDVVLCKTIISLAKNMGLSIIAEGVEKKEQKDFLIANGCLNIQGFLYSKAIPANEMTEYLKHENSRLSA